MGKLAEMIVIKSSADGRIFSEMPLVRCKNCVHYDGEGTCLKMGIVIPDGNWFCSDGEKRGE